MRSNRNTTRLTRTQQIRRSDIIQAAIRVISRDGYAAASLDEIAQEASTSKGTVLYHFKSRSAIEEVVIGAVFEEGTEYIANRITATAGYRDKIHTYIISNLAYIADHLEHIAAVHQILLNNRWPEDDEVPFRQLQKLLETGQARGELGSFDAQSVAIAIRIIIDGSSFYLLAHPEIDIHAYAENIAQIFDKTIAKQ